MQANALTSEPPGKLYSPCIIRQGRRKAAVCDVQGRLYPVSKDMLGHMKAE